MKQRKQQRVKVRYTILRIKSENLSYFTLKEKYACISVKIAVTLQLPYSHKNNLLFGVKAVLNVAGILIFLCNKHLIRNWMGILSKTQKEGPHAYKMSVVSSLRKRAVCTFSSPTYIHTPWHNYPQTDIIKSLQNLYKKDRSMSCFLFARKNLL